MTKMIQSLRSKNFASFYLLSLFFLLAFFYGDLNAATIFVGPPPASIQTAINGASNGDTIQLSAGTYVEEVQVISKSLNIVGKGKDISIIQSPGPATHLTQNFSFGGFNWWCVLMVDNAAAPTPQTVNISDLTVDGDNQQDTSIPPIYGNSDRFFAIGYHNANGTVNSVHTTNTKQSSNFNEITGGGIISAANNGTVTTTIMDTLVDFYQRIGIDCRGATLTANISDNTVNRGYVLTPSTITATPNGIQFSGANSGYIIQNVVSGNIGTVANAAGSGIIIFGADPNVTIAGNTVNNNDAGIVGLSSGNNLRINNNTLNFTTTPGINPPEGIIVQDTSGLTAIISNVMNNIPSINMDLFSSTDQPFQLMNNQFNGSATGLLVTGSTPLGPEVTMSHDTFTGTAGYYIHEVTAPHDIWPSTATVTFDGMVSGFITFPQFNALLLKIFDKHNDPTLGLVLDFILPFPTTPAPAVTSVTAISGPESGGNTVTITGTDFISSNTTVHFGSAAALITVVNNTTITATVPPSLSLGTVNVTVTTPAGTSSIVPGDQYTYVAGGINPPIVTTLDLNYGSIDGGNTITVNGSGFISGGTLVHFGANQGTNVIVNSNLSLTVIVPLGISPVDVTVTTIYGTSVPSNGSKYYYLALSPSVSGLNPNFGPEAGGTVVMITGSGFINGDTNVFFGSTSATNIIVNSPTSITATSPPGTGVVNVTVVTSFGTSPIVLADQFTYTGLAPLPPSNFVGVIQTNKFLNKTDYILRATFDPSPSSNVVFYRIYKNGVVVAVIPAGSPLVFVTCLTSTKTVNQYEVAAVNSNNIESAHVPIRIAI